MKMREHLKIFNEKKCFDVTDKIYYLKQILYNSKYTVALCGSGMLRESGLYSLKSPEFSMR